MPREITVNFADGSTRVYQNVPDEVTADQAWARARADNPDQPVLGIDGGKPGSDPNGAAKEMGRVAYKATVGGAAGWPGINGDIALSVLRKFGQSAPELLKDIKSPMDLMPKPGQGLMVPLRAIAALSATKPVQDTKFGDVTHQLESGFGMLPHIEPETETGKVAANVLEPAVGTALWGQGPMMSKVLTGLGAGGGGEAANRLFPDNPVMRVIGAVIGSAGVSALDKAFHPTAKELVRSATENTKPDDWQRAKDDSATLKTAGVPHLASQVIPNSTLPELVALAGTNPLVAPRLRSAVQSVPEDATSAVKAWSDKNLPVGGLSQSDILTDVQGKATKVLADSKSKAGAAYGGAVPAGLNESNMAPQQVAAMVNDIRQRFAPLGPTADATKAANNFIVNKLTDPVTGELITNRGAINHLYKELNQLGSQEGFQGLDVRGMRDVLSKYTQEYQPARDAWKASIASDYVPKAQGLVGDLANFKGGPNIDKSTVSSSMLSNVFNPKVDQTAKINLLAKSIGDEAVGALTREQIAQTLATSIRSTKSNQANIQTPADFYNALAGNSIQKANIEAGLAAAARAQGSSPQETIDGFWKLMKALDTTKNLKLPDFIDPGQAADIASRNAVSTIVAPRLKVSRYFGNLATAKTYGQIADIVTSPTGVQQLEQIAKTPDMSRAHLMAIGIFTSGAQASEGYRKAQAASAQGQ